MRLNDQKRLLSSLQRAARDASWGAALAVWFPFAYLRDRMSIAGARYRWFDGIAVGSLNHRKAEAYWSKVGEALAFIGTIDSRRYRRLRADVPRILVVPVAGAYFSLITMTCFLDEACVADRSKAVIASRLVHEATHARLARGGLRYGPRSIERIEALCIREELSFVRLLPRDQFNVDGFVRFQEEQLRVYPPSQRWPTRLLRRTPRH